MQLILHHPALTAATGFLLAAYAITTALSMLAFPPPNTGPGLILATWFFLLLGFLITVLLCTLVARLLGGRANWAKQALAFAWGQLPAFLVLLVFALVFLGLRAITGVILPTGVRTALNVLALIWSTVTTASAMAVVNRFSWRRGVAVALVPLLFGLLNYFP